MAVAPKSAQPKGGLFKMDHSLGQNILRSKVVVKNIVDAGEPRPGDKILEIGPGNGNMTEEMLSREGIEVIAIEKDQRMCVELKKKFPRHPNLRIINADVLSVDLPEFDLCISNIPYNISSAIVFKLLARPTFRRTVLMVQKEFGERIVARPGKDGWGRLAINTQLYASVKLVMNVSRKNFVPPPKVDSIVVSIQPREVQPDIDFNEWDGLIKLCFTRPNRTLQATFHKKKIRALLNENREKYLSSINQQATMSIEELIEYVLGTTVLAQSRPMELDIEDFLNLLKEFNNGGVHFQ
ncbi:dimethyladenosine transferase family protein [Trichomonas vaginalis G3]|uniref:rRNA adenine N(6)-methyltransferase n=1 Tax=Trichomonas vaginalis (strain ATCC PRA-98 / G3) TaxID=412133 RepID=A2EVN6_TRIV3|nr:rRNA (adenine-N6,N6-)-dimethyltransferase protein [Trichomonas vaginalis G3]EAY03246.1 dimethyladenosine transferase family protein [Trichomonas vaginalis G3]KAI5535600.1 rRNA (adenine-N6,N6-)-dimethyltransferase protein [Trichomonas vaginalis G3]|eukprot:XP_001315469.1 dimethyladenosine transferase family protein [Trichomonas vaginalis G3]